MKEYLNHITPENVLRWTGVAFVVALEILFVIAIILSMMGVFE